MPPSLSRTLARRAVLSFTLLAVLATVGTVVLWGRIGAAEPGSVATLRALLAGLLALKLIVLAGLWFGSVSPAMRAVGRAFRDARLGNARLAAQGEELEQQNEMLSRQQDQLLRQAEELEAQNATLFTQHDELERQAAALREAQELTSAIVVGAREGIFAFDLACRYTVWNPAMERLYGVPAERVIGRRPDEAFAQLVTPTIRDAHERALRGESVTQKGRRVPTGRAGPDGTAEMRVIDASYEPLRGADGSVIGCVGLLHDVTEAVQTAEELERLSTVVRHTADAVSIRDADGRFVWTNAAWERMTGWTLAEVRGRGPEILYGPDTDAATCDAIGAAAACGESWSGELLEYRRDGTTYWIALTATPVRDADGAIAGFVSIGRDVSERRAAEHERQRLATVVRISPDGVGVTDAEGRFEFVNESHARMFGYDDPAALLGRHWSALYSPDELSRLMRDAMPLIAAGGHWQGEGVGCRADGSTFPQEVTLSRLPTGGVVCVMRDVTERKAQEELLRSWSLRDELTGLYNRRGFLATARERLAAARKEGVPSVLLYMDLDDFKAINDTLGHDAGDAALVEMAGALRAAFRGTDIIGRLGGDEFVVLATHCPPIEADAMRTRLDRALARRGARSVPGVALASSVGVVTDEVPAHAGSGDLEALLRAADSSLYADKRARKAARPAAPPSGVRALVERSA